MAFGGLSNPRFCVLLSPALTPAVAMNAVGDFVVVWNSDGSDGSDVDDYSIQAQRYNSGGTAQGSQFQVNTYSTSGQRSPAVSLDADGDFVVTWMSYSPGGTDTDNSSIQAQRYNSSGTAQGSQFQVNTYTTGGQFGTAVAMDADGDFVVTWQSWGSSETDTDRTSVQAQRYPRERVFLPIVVR